MPGKNLMQNGNKKRLKGDRYQTPYSCTKQLMEVEKFEGIILEPACGNGAILSVLKMKNYDVSAYDISFYPYINFLQSNGNIDNIITNPPFSLALEFILKAKEIYRNKIAFFMPLSYLHGLKRYEAQVFKELKTVYVFVRYILLSNRIREDGKYKTGYIAYAWYVWEKEYKGHAYIKHINNQKYVLPS